MNYFTPDFTAVVLNIILALLSCIAAGVFVFTAWNEYKLYQVRCQERAVEPIIKLWENEEAPLRTSAAEYLRLIA